MAKTVVKTKKIPKNHKQTKQLTLEMSHQENRKEPSPASIGDAPKKSIIITGINALTKEEEIALKVGFRLHPSKAAFSKVCSDLWFDSHKISSISIRIPQGPLAANDFEFTTVLDMKGIVAGSYKVKIEMYELWSSGEKLCCTSKEETIEYVPVTRESRLIKIPFVKSVAGTDLTVASESENAIYKEIDQSAKKELITKRDEW